MQTWIFQTNPTKFNIDGYMKAIALTRLALWEVKQFANQIKRGDLVYIWRAEGDTKHKGNGGIIAECKVISEVAPHPADEVCLPFWANHENTGIANRVQLKVLRIANKQEVIKRSWLLDDWILQDLSILKQPQGGSFKVTSDQARRIGGIWRRTGKDWDRNEVVAALYLYAKLSDKSGGYTVEQISHLIGRVKSAILLKLHNITSLDPRNSQSGLTKASKMDALVWSEFFDIKTKILDESALHVEFKRLWDDDHGDETILHSEINQITEVHRQVAVRTVQGVFRDQLLKYWKGKCSVTGVAIKELLTASHIIPWKVSNHIERQDVMNGLMLAPNLERPFDRGFITFDDHGCIQFSSELPIDVRSQLGLSTNMRIIISDQHLKYLRWHRAEVFRK